jgi:hypothetical protein
LDNNSGRKFAFAFNRICDDGGLPLVMAHCHLLSVCWARIEKSPSRTAVPPQGRRSGHPYHPGENTFEPTTYLIGHTRFKKTPIGEIPQGWEVKRLSGIAEVIDCKHRTPKYSPEGYPVIRPGDLVSGPLSLEGCLRVSKDEYDDLVGKHVPQIGDIVYSRNQNYGISAIVERDDTFAIGQDVCLIHPQRLRPHFLHYVLSSELIWHQIRKIMAGSTFK